ncbi:hypothetical protein [Bradyrhizobium sp. NP1]|uniref:hypothetical protein n=1 Tax=Bradyrhizobium sp. NP1 TaxID=3049772 RepID=UPI0025A4DF8A|nr:hypothetical protein [Bradyrhizobium sp. NP1]WJR74923.1 hypothetical protein QOU61_19030 [Bradyrhizobium sp. NP1]
MKQATVSLPRLFEDYQAVAAEKRRIYGFAAQAADADLDAAEAACDAAYDALEAIADAILAIPTASIGDLVIKAQVLLARGADPADLFHYRPIDLSRFVQEVQSLSVLGTDIPGRKMPATLADVGR